MCAQAQCTSPTGVHERAGTLCQTSSALTLAEGLPGGGNDLSYISLSFSFFIFDEKCQKHPKSSAPPLWDLCCLILICFPWMPCPSLRASPFIFPTFFSLPSCVPASPLNTTLFASTLFFLSFLLPPRGSIWAYRKWRRLAGWLAGTHRDIFVWPPDGLCVCVCVFWCVQWPCHSVYLWHSASTVCSQGAPPHGKTDTDAHITSISLWHFAFYLPSLDLCFFLLTWNQVTPISRHFSWSLTFTFTLLCCYLTFLPNFYPSWWNAVIAVTIISSQSDIFHSCLSFFCFCRTPPGFFRWVKPLRAKERKRITLDS